MRILCFDKYLITTISLLLDLTRSSFIPDSMAGFNAGFLKYTHRVDGNVDERQRGVEGW
jgi:hypothetical protein